MKVEGFGCVGQVSSQRGVKNDASLGGGVSLRENGEVGVSED